MKPQPFISPLYTKLIQRMIFLIIIPFLLVIVFLFGVAQNGLSKEFGLVNDRFAAQLSSSVETNRIQAEALAKAIEENSELINFISKDYTPGLDFSKYDRIVANNIKGFAKSRPDIIIRIFMNNTSIPQGYGLFYQTDYLDRLPAVSDFIVSEEREIWLDMDSVASESPLQPTHPLYTTSHSYLYLKRLITYASNTLGYIAILVPQNTLIPVFKEGSKYTVQKYLGNIYVNNSNIAITSKDMKSIVLQGKQYGRYDKLAYSTFHMEPIPGRLIILSSGNSNNIMFPAFTSAFILFAFAALYFFIRYIHKFVDDIQRCIDETQNSITSNFSFRLHSSANKEIARITNSINLLLDRISQLVQETIRQQAEVKNAQLQALQHQINPHFLYNTLEIFAGKMEKQGLYKESDALTSFAQMFRYNISTGPDALTTIQAEILNVQRYLSIQKLSRPNIRLKTDISDVLMNTPMLRFMLQPLVENSVKHGIAHADDSLVIGISIELNENHLHFTIFDNGIGMPEDKISRLNEMFDPNYKTGITASPSDSIGLSNINTRLRLFYNSRLFIHTGDINGTVISFDIPLSEGNPKNLSAGNLPDKTITPRFTLM